MRPTIALLTDFGSRDHYVGAVKGAILSVCSDATLVDIAHDLPAHDVAEGAFCLAGAHRTFPSGVVFLAVVDPGVGSARRSLALEAGGYLFVGPDNGIFTLILSEHRGARVHEVTARGFFRPDISATFHARDVFGPVAGHLASGIPLDEVGPLAPDPVVFTIPGLRRQGPEEWEATVVHVDRFGNLVTNVTKHDLEAMQAEAGDAEIVAVVEGVVVPFVITYADIHEGEACALMGSCGHLEIAVHRGNASRLLGAGKGAPVRLRAVATTF